MRYPNWHVIFVLLLLHCWVICPTWTVIGSCHGVPELGRYCPGPAGIGPITVRFWCIVVVHRVVLLKMIVYTQWYITQRREKLSRYHFELCPQVLGEMYYEGNCSTMTLRHVEIPISIWDIPWLAPQGQAWVVSCVHQPDLIEPPHCCILYCLALVRVATTSDCTYIVYICINYLGHMWIVCLGSTGRAILAP